MEFNASPVQRQRCAMAFLTRYSAALANGKALWLERRLASLAIRQLLKRGERNATDLVRERTRKDHKGRRRIVTDGEDALPLKGGELRQVQVLLRRVNRFGAGNRLRLLDAARRVSGLASLGLTRFVALVAHGTAKKEKTCLDRHQTRTAIARPKQRTTEALEAGSGARGHNRDRAPSTAAPHDHGSFSGR